MPFAHGFRNEKGRPEDRPFPNPSKTDYAALFAFAFFAARLRAISPAAAAPNSITIGGAGTSVPPVEPPSPPFDPPLELDEEDDELVELDVDDDVLDDVEVLPPKLEDDVDVDVLTPPVDVETPPVEVETPPVEVETPPVEVEVETPPVDVETPPDVLDVLEPPVDVDELEPPDDVLDPPVEVLVMCIPVVIPAMNRQSRHSVII